MSLTKWQQEDPSKYTLGYGGIMRRVKCVGFYDSPCDTTSCVAKRPRLDDDWYCKTHYNEFKSTNRPVQRDRSIYADGLGLNCRGLSLIPRESGALGVISRPLKTGGSELGWWTYKSSGKEAGGNWETGNQADLNAIRGGGREGLQSTREE